MLISKAIRGEPEAVIDPIYVQTAEGQEEEGSPSRNASTREQLYRLQGSTTAPQNQLRGKKVPKTYVGVNFSQFCEATLTKNDKFP